MKICTHITWGNHSFIYNTFQYERKFSNNIGNCKHNLHNIWCCLHRNNVVCTTSFVQLIRSKLFIQRRELYIHKHRRLCCVSTTIFSVHTNTCFIFKDTAVYPGTHVVYLQTQHVLMFAWRLNCVSGYRNYIQAQSYNFMIKIWYSELYFC